MSDFSDIFGDIPDLDEVMEYDDEHDVYGDVDDVYDYIYDDIYDDDIFQPPKVFPDVFHNYDVGKTDLLIPEGHEREESGSLKVTEYEEDAVPTLTLPLPICYTQLLNGQAVLDALAISKDKVIAEDMLRRYILVKWPPYNQSGLLIWDPEFKLYDVLASAPVSKRGIRLRDFIERGHLGDELVLIPHVGRLLKAGLNKYVKNDPKQLFRFNTGALELPNNPDGLTIAQQGVPRDKKGEKFELAIKTDPEIWKSQSLRTYKGNVEPTKPSARKRAASKLLERMLRLLPTLVTRATSGGKDKVAAYAQRVERFTGICGARTRKRKQKSKSLLSKAPDKKKPKEDMLTRVNTLLDVYDQQPLAKLRNREARTDYNFKGSSESDQLSFKEGEILILLSPRINNDWYVALNSSGVVGWVPFNYIRVIRNTNK